MAGTSAALKRPLALVPSAPADMLVSTAVGFDRRRGRGAQTNASGRYEPLARVAFDDGWQSLEELPPFATTVTVDATRKIIERIGDLAVNLAQRVITLREMPGAQLPDELAPMAAAVRAMVSKSLGALIFRNADMAALVLESDDVVDKYRDTIFEKLMENMTQQASLVSSGMQFVLATRHLERIADHATNIAEDIIFWVRGLDVRHGRGLVVSSEMQAGDTEEVVRITDNSHPLHPAVKVIGDTQPA